MPFGVDDALIGLVLASAVSQMARQGQQGGQQGQGGGLPLPDMSQMPIGLNLQAGGKESAAPTPTAPPTPRVNVSSDRFTPSATAFRQGLNTAPGAGTAFERLRRAGVV